MEREIPTANVLLMAGFVAVEMTNQVSAKRASGWLAGVVDAPEKWHRETRAFFALIEGEGGHYTYEAAARAIVAALGVERA